MFPGFLLTAFLLHLTLASDLPVSTDNFVRCQNKVYEGTILDSVVVRSTTHCAAVCSRNDNCQVMSVCIRDGSVGQVECSLLGNGIFQPRSMTVKNGTTHCFQLIKVHPDVIQETTTAPVTTSAAPLCLNGGTLLNGACRCPIQFGGTKCQRLIRDCTEPLQYGHTTDSQGIPLRIQPDGAPDPFWIVCILLWGGGFSYPLIRYNMMSFNVNWTTAKSRIGEDSSVISAHYDYFIGLENLHYLVSQGQYDLHLYCQFSGTQGWRYYYNVSVGPENSSYVLSYQSSSPRQDYPLDNIFSGGEPFVFSTNDHDPRHCNRGYPGWFGSDCSGYSLFADPATLTVNGAMKTLSYIQFGVTRT